MKKIPSWRIVSRKRNDPFLKDIVTGDELWVFYHNDQRKRKWIDKDKSPQLTTKADLQGRKFMLYIWWDYSSISHFWVLKLQSNSCQAYIKIFKENIPHSSIGELLYFPERRKAISRKNTEFRVASSFIFILDTEFPLHQVISIFRSVEITLKEKGFFQEEQVKRFLVFETIWILLDRKIIYHIVIYKALCFDVAQGRMYGAPNETRTHSCRFASLDC